MSAERVSYDQVRAALGEGVICSRCGATLDTYDEACTSALDDPCPGFQAIEVAMGNPEYGAGDRS